MSNNYNGQHPFKKVGYFKSGKLYLEEKYGWDEKSWMLNQSEEYTYDYENHIKFKVRRTFRNGKVENIYESFVIYEYY